MIDFYIFWIFYRVQIGNGGLIDGWTMVPFLGGVIDGMSPVEIGLKILVKYFYLILYNINFLILTRPPSSLRAAWTSFHAGWSHEYAAAKRATESFILDLYIR